MPDLTSIAFGQVPFDEAIRYLRQLSPVSADQWAELSLNARRDAFSFADAASDSAADAVKRVLEAAMVDPVRANFQERANAVLDEWGISLSSRQADTIFDTVMNRAINQGKWSQAQDADIQAAFPYIGLDTAMDSRVRPNHFAMDWRRIKTVFSINDPGWKDYYPPLGFRCRCTIRFFSQAEVESMGLVVGRLSDWIGKSVTVAMPNGEEVPTVIAPDAGFASGTLTAKDSEQLAVVSGQCGCGKEHPAALPFDLILLNLATHYLRKAA